MVDVGLGLYERTINFWVHGENFDGTIKNRYSKGTLRSIKLCSDHIVWFNLVA
jgi:hypothetical protein